MKGSSAPRSTATLAHYVAAIVVLASCTLALPSIARAQESTPAFTCQPTLPNNVNPPAHLLHYADPEHTFYMDGIWTGIYPDGVMLIDKESTIASGEYEGWRAQKMWWTRNDGVEGPLIVTGTRLDGDAPEAVNLFFDGQYGSSGFTPVSLAFAAEGCWQITGTVGEHTTTFVMGVDFVDVYPWMETPEA